MDHSMGDMDMGGDQAACKMKMFWNWYTLDSCFLAESWHVTSKGMFAGTCIGIIILVMSIEFFRRLQREYDRLIVRQWQALNMKSASEASSLNEENKQVSMRTLGLLNFSNGQSNSPNFQPTLTQQLVRSVFYTVQVGAAYIVMLILMSFNGYTFFCILIGALLGHMLFATDSITDGLHQETAKGPHCC